MNKIQEAEYNDFLRKKTITKLDAKSKENLKQLLGDMSSKEIAQEMMFYLEDIMMIEYPHKYALI